MKLQLLLFLCASAQSRQQKNIVAAAGVQGSSFSCSGRSSGYYADVETGCQSYHYCDVVGHQFSYACPNNTLFQQRMLICDHWFMVDCSKSQQGYSANLLIGQQGKPFVSEEEELQMIQDRKPVNFRKIDTNLGVTSNSLSEEATTRKLQPFTKPTITYTTGQHFITGFSTTTRPYTTRQPLFNKFTAASRPFSNPNPVLQNQLPLDAPFNPDRESRNFDSSLTSPTKKVTQGSEISEINESKLVYPEARNGRNVIKLSVDDPRTLFFIPNNNQPAPSSSQGLTEYFLSVNENQLPGMRFKKQPEIEPRPNRFPVCPSHCHPGFLVPGTCHPCIMIK